ncbi:amino acid adenylation domain-containing protein [Spongiimicrobium salis]|uniref:amino acid adenylation domain-containing protein n=1 Tax=Spongiimicrobium salis TaxID=1667022 RepID=UPI00374C9730
MKIEDYITQLRKKHNVLITNKNGELKVTSKAPLEQELINEIKRRKPEITAFFNAVAASKAIPVIGKAEKKSAYPLSSVQKRMYFLQSYQKESLAYNMPHTLEIQGNLDIDKFKWAINKVFQRHEILRTRFTLIEGEPIQQIVNDIDLEIALLKNTEDNLPEIIAQCIKPFNLEEPPLMRVTLIAITSSRYILVFDVHHIAMDGFSFGIFMRDFVAFYKGEELETLEIQYKDYAVWEQSKAFKKRSASQKQFWKNEFAQELSVIDLPMDYSRPNAKSGQGDTVSVNLSMTQTKALKTIAIEEKTTMFTILLTIFNVVLGKLSNRDDIVVGTSVIGRHYEGVENTLGMFSNIIPLRNFPKQNLSFKDFLRECKERMLQCLDHQEYKYEELIEELKLERHLSRNPLFDIIFDYQNLEEEAFEIPGLSMFTYHYDQKIAKFDLSLTAKELHGSIQFHFEYATDLFKKNTVEKFAACMKHAIAVVLKKPEIKLRDLKILTDKEEEQIISALKGKGNPLETSSILDYFEKQTKESPDRTAIYYGSEEMTFEKLNRTSDALAHKLKEEYNIEVGDYVGVQLDRSEYMIITILGILKVGATFVPVDPDYPHHRKAYIAENAELKLLVTASNYLFETDYFDGDIMAIDIEFDSEEYKEVFPGTVTENNQSAYVIYTSGSTGKPKGVEISHKALLNYVSWGEDFYGFDQNSVFGLHTSLSFDLTLTSIFSPLFSGGGIFVFEQYESSTLLENVLNEDKVNVVKLTPSHLKMVVENKNIESEVKRKFIVGGEQLETALAAKVMDKFKETCVIYNEYGPTETTVGCVAHKFDKKQNFPSVAIGKPIYNTRLYILDESQNVCPRNVQGELYIGGFGLAKHYVNNAELTRERFIEDPYVKGQFIYRTGDKVLLLPDDTLRYIGRVDDQVKINGYRIELGEIEAALMQHDQITETAVITQEIQDKKHLVAYVTSNTVLETEGLRSFLGKFLPEYMVPKFYMVLEEMPLTFNGKVNKPALPPYNLELTSTYIAPTTKEEKILVEVWSSVLGIDKIGIVDDFFSLGGDSIRSLQISSRLQDEGYHVLIKDIFEYRTIRELAPKLICRNTQSDQEIIVDENTTSPIQQWFFEGPIENKDYFNHGIVLRFKKRIDEHTVRNIFKKILEHHDALRMVFRKEKGQWVQENREYLGDIFLKTYSFEENYESIEKEIISLSNQIQSSMDIGNGPLMRLGLFNSNDASHLLIVIHHLVVDGVSWRILLEDMDRLYQQEMKREALKLPSKTAPFITWPTHLHNYLKSKSYQEAKVFWENQKLDTLPRIPKDYQDQTLPLLEDVSQQLFVLSPEYTTKLLKESNLAFNTQINDLLLTALLMSVSKTFGMETIAIDMEGHGREEINETVNVHRTIGWFTSIFPVVLRKTAEDIPAVVKSVKETLRQVPNKGIDYLIASYMDSQAHTLQGNDPQICFNYLGQFEEVIDHDTFTMENHLSGNAVDTAGCRSHEIDVLSMVNNGRLELQLVYSKKHHKDTTFSRWAKNYKKCLEDVIDVCCAADQVTLSPSDMTYKNIPITALEALQEEYDIEDIYPLSPMQEGLFFHYLMEPRSQAYFEQITLHVQGDLKLDKVENAMNALTKRYSVLRTLFKQVDEVDRPLQIVLSERKVEFAFKDIRNESEGKRKETVIQQYQQNDKTRKFDLETDALIRLLVLRTSINEYTFIWSHHHIIMDGWCVSILISEFEKYYLSYIDKQEVELPSIKPYSKYIQWIENTEKEVAFQYWKEYLSEFNTATGIPKITTKKVPYVHKDFSKYLGKAKTRDLQAFCIENSTTTSSVLQMAWGILLQKYNNTNDVVFGTVVSGRPPSITGVDTMVGLFINTVPVRIKSNKETIMEALSNSQKEALVATDYHYTPLSDIQSLSELKGALLDHIMVFENFPIAEQIDKGEKTKEGGLSFLGAEFFEQTGYDLTLIIVPHNDDITIKASYNTERYDTKIIEKVVDQLIRVVDEILLSPNKKIHEISVLEKEEFNRLKKGYTVASEDYGTGTLLDLFEKQVQDNPEQVALLFEGARMTYGELNIRANQLAHRLKNEGVGPDSMVPICVERSLEMVIGLLGILKAGGAYVPIDLDYPTARIDYILNDVEANFILMTTSSKKTLGALSTIKTILLDDVTTYEEYQKHNPTREDLYRNLAYVIYTSGTTGTPKGVMNEHRSIYNRLLWMRKYLGTDRKLTTLQKTTFCFDVSVWEFFLPLISGSKLVIAKPEGHKDPEYLWKLIEEYKINLIHFVPSMLQLFLEKTKKNENTFELAHVICSGEALPLNLVNVFKSNMDKVCLHNFYGPTEAAIDVTAIDLSKIDVNKMVPIGYPVPNTPLYVVDKWNNLQLEGVPGELWIGGIQVSRGYLNRLELTEEKFVDNIFDDQDNNKLYKTGDMVQWTSDKGLMYLGRMDDQVKIRGYRIELGEIAHRLRTCPGIEQGEVIVKMRNDEPYLVGYYKADKIIASEELIAFLKQSLPLYMIPMNYVKLETFPLTSNGKLDKNQMPDPEGNAKDFIAPENEIESKLAEIWGAVLKIDAKKIGIHDDFFALGGHSIKAVDMLHKISRIFSVKISLKDVFEHPTIHALGAYILKTESPLLEEIPRVPEAVQFVVSSAQERMFFENFANPHSLAYNIFGAYKIEGNLDLDRLALTLDLLVQRHESLRTSFHFNDLGVVQKIHPFSHSNFRYFEDALAENIDGVLKNFIKPFDLAEASLIRFGLTRITGTWLFLVDVHHIVCDGISLNILMNDFNRIYQGKDIEQLSLRYVDFASWQRDKKEHLSEAKEYWKAELAEEILPMELPRLQEKNGLDFSKANIELLKIHDERFLQFKNYIREFQVSEFMFFTAIYALMISKITGKSDIIIGTDVMGRTHPNLQHIVGTFINVLPLRLRIGPKQSFTDFLLQVKQKVLKGFEHQNFQIDDMLALANNSENSTSFIDVHFAFSNFFSEENAMEGLIFEPVHGNDNTTTQYEFKIEAVEIENTIVLQFIYSEVLYDSDTIKVFVQYFDEILTSVLKNNKIGINGLEVATSL